MIASDSLAIPSSVGKRLFFAIVARPVMQQRTEDLHCPNRPFALRLIQIKRLYAHGPALNGPIGRFNCARVAH